MQQKIRLISFAFGTAASLALCLMLDYQAGCMGDTKGGTLGNPVAALRLESYAFAFYLLGLVLLGASLARALKTRIRWLVVGVAVVSAAVLMFVIGLEAEHAGIRQCF